MILPPAPSKSARTYDALRGRIIAMRLRPGARLAERELCAELGISRAPFREAVCRLAQEGLVMVVPSDATFVNPIVMRQVVVGHFMRANLEVPAVLLASQRAGKADLRARITSSIGWRPRRKRAMPMSPLH
ncbi:GntR family transcriptional regulator [Falsirhodobacter deserti]|uniref:GntR family transcriptional regulator n=1 Tax=Falsirhodobacter deserti TaxID=1365611 RepID=UPI000FE2EC54|nr:GntR family transcriptional regulator [Falsirhodobacter deserti]